MLTTRSEASCETTNIGGLCATVPAIAFTRVFTKICPIPSKRKESVICGYQYLLRLLSSWLLVLNSPRHLRIQ